MILTWCVELEEMRKIFRVMTGAGSHWSCCHIVQLVSSKLSIMILSLMLCSLTVGGSAKLVFDGDSVDLDNYDILLSIRDDGELINTTTRPLHFCPEVDERIDVYRVYLRQENGEESEKYVELSTRLDLTYIHNKVSNAEEPWIKTDILKR